MFILAKNTWGDDDSIVNLFAFETKDEAREELARQYKASMRFAKREKMLRGSCSPESDPDSAWITWTDGDATDWRVREVSIANNRR